MVDNTDNSLNGAATTAPDAPQVNPLNPSEALKRPAPGNTTEPANPQSDILPLDSATTRAEKVERHGITDDQQPSKRVKREQDAVLGAVDPSPRNKGVAPIKKEYLIANPSARPAQVSEENPDDAAEGSKHESQQQQSKDKKQKSRGGQNKARTFGSSRDALQLCKTRVHNNEFSPGECPFGDKCKMEHNLRKYLSEGKREDLTTFDKRCPIFDIKGKCNAGWKCRFAGSHSTERETADGRKELVLLDNDKSAASNGAQQDEENEGLGVVNVVPISAKIDLRKRKTNMPKSEAYVAWLDKRQTEMTKFSAINKPEEEQAEIKSKMSIEEHRAQFTECPVRASEKRRIYYGPETPVLAPLTTQGNLPFRRLCVGLGAQITWSEMAMGLPLIQGEKGEWALTKAHESETTPPTYKPKSIVTGYDNSKDLKFGVQIAGNKPWNVLKTTEILTALCPSIRAIDLNCGCPIDLVYRQGAGSALMDTPGKLEKILRGMNAVSNETPITVKIRMGTKDNHPTADKLVQRLVLGGEEAIATGDGPCGVAAITLHGRSRQQRYTRQANWEYISECSALVARLKQKQAAVTDTIKEADARDMTASNHGTPYFCGNGDIYSHTDYFDAINNAAVDSCMIGRGALIKPWIFEEIQSGQYLDKSATERLQYIEQFTRFGLENWGSDEIGVGVTRRFLLEWLSFSCRYVPIGLLEHLPPQMNDRAPAYRGRNELETLLSSANYKDWIKIRQVFSFFFFFFFLFHFFSFSSFVFLFFLFLFFLFFFPCSSSSPYRVFLHG
jgi:tRNA-dihydrouridine synthase 3